MNCVRCKGDCTLPEPYCSWTCAYAQGKADGVVKEREECAVMVEGFDLTGVVTFGSAGACVLKDETIKAIRARDKGVKL